MEKLSELLKSLMKDKLLTEYELLNSDECVGVEKDKIYLTMNHTVNLFEDKRYGLICSMSVMDDTYCFDRETKEYESQFLFQI
jgi:hypothetical protein